MKAEMLWAHLGRKCQYSDFSFSLFLVCFFGVVLNIYSTVNVKIARSTQWVDLVQESEGRDHMQRKAQRAPVSKYAHTLCMFRLKL